MQTKEDWALVLLLNVTIRLFQRAVVAMLDIPRVVRNTRAGLKIPPPRCQLCGAQAIDKEPGGCLVCWEALQSSAVSPKTFVQLRILDWLPWAAGVLSVIALALPTLVFLYALVFELFGPLALEAQGQSIGAIVFGSVLVLVISPLIILMLLGIFNLFVFTAKEFITVRNELLFDRTGVFRFHLRAGIHLALVYFLLVPFASSDQFRAAYVFLLVALPQTLIFLTPSAFYLSMRIVRDGLVSSLSHGYSAMLIKRYPVIGRAGGSLDMAEGLEASNVELGQQGEQGLAYAISSVLEGKGVLFNSLRVPGMTNADLDHVLLVGDTVMIVDSKVWAKGEYEVVQGNVWRDGQPFPGGSVHLEEMRLALQNYLGDGFEVTGRIVILNNEASLGAETHLSTSCVLQLLEDFAHELRTMVGAQTPPLNAGVLSDLLELSKTSLKPPPIDDCLTAIDEWIVYERWKA